jgi:hypothetical protein
VIVRKAKAHIVVASPQTNTLIRLSNATLEMVAGVFPAAVSSYENDEI